MCRLWALPARTARPTCAGTVGGGAGYGTPDFVGNDESSLISVLSHLWRGRLPEGRLRGEISNGGLIWLYLAPFTPSREAENEAGVVSFGSRSLVRAEPAWPRCGLVWPWLRIRGRGWEWPEVAKLLIRFHLLPFRPIPYRLRGPGMRGSRLRGNDGTLSSLRRMQPL